LRSPYRAALGASPIFEKFMNHKIIANDQTEGGVVLVRHLDEDGDNFVRASFWTKGDESYYERIYQFETETEAHSFIRDYSPVSATDLVDNLA